MVERITPYMQAAACTYGVHGKTFEVVPSAFSYGVTFIVFVTQAPDCVTSVHKVIDASML